ncbi:MAG: hypothetical protein AAGK09_02265 [Planctomycetota bacterium]
MFWISLLLIVMGLLGCIPLFIRIENRRLRSVELRFLREREPVPDAVYVAWFDNHSIDSEQALWARKVTAELCGVPAEMISPLDKVQTLLDLQIMLDFTQWKINLHVDTRGSGRELDSVLSWTFGEFVVFALQHQEKTPA